MAQPRFTPKQRAKLYDFLRSPRGVGWSHEALAKHYGVTQPCITRNLAKERKSRKAPK